MKKLLSIAVLAAMLSSCSVTRGYVGHSIHTQVELREANFKIVSSVTGSASAQTVLGLGINQSELYARARKEMIEKAQIYGTSRTVINVTTDVKTTWYLICRITTVIVSGGGFEPTHQLVQSELSCP